MTFGRELRLAALSFGLCLLLAAEPSVAVPGWDLPDLMAAMARVKSASANFAERKTIHILNAPLLDTGTLSYTAPDQLRKTTVAPLLEIFALAHGEASITGGADGQTQNFPLAGNPQIGGLVEGILATLAGDQPTLERFYAARLTGTPQSWWLTLQPRDAAVGHFIKTIMIHGACDRIDTIDTASPNGDHSEMGIIETTRDAD